MSPRVTPRSVVPCPNVAQALRVNTRVLPDGRQTVSVRAQDSASNWGASEAVVPVDNTAPGPPIDVSMVGGE